MKLYLGLIATSFFLIACNKVGNDNGKGQKTSPNSDKVQSITVKASADAVYGKIKAEDGQIYESVGWNTQPFEKSEKVPGAADHFCVTGFDGSEQVAYTLSDDELTLHFLDGNIKFVRVSAIGSGIIGGKFETSDWLTSNSGKTLYKQGYDFTEGQVTRLTTCKKYE